MSEDDKIDILVELFGWEKSDEQARFAALRTLRAARGEEFPTWDDFRAKRTR